METSDSCTSLKYKSCRNQTDKLAETSGTVEITKLIISGFLHICSDSAARSCVKCQITPFQYLYGLNTATIRYYHSRHYQFTLVLSRMVVSYCSSADALYIFSWFR